MSGILYTKRAVRAMAVAACMGLVVAVANADIVLVDFGNDDSFRGLSQVGVDDNGNTWNSVWSGAFYSGLLDINGDATTINLGFSSAPGTDSFNGPAGDTTTGAPDFLFDPTTVDNVTIDATALGLLGGSAAAAFDFYVDSTFQIQNLNPAFTYNLTFFGSHKFNTDDTTRYTVYTDNTYSVPVDTADLVVGVGSAHNQDTTVTISGLSPQTGNTLYIGFEGADGTSSGYLNAMQIEVIPEPGTLVLLTCGALVLWMKRRCT